MKAMKPGLVITVLVCFLICSPNRASARTSFHIGIGCHYSNFRSRCHPHHRWHGGYHRWHGGYHRWRHHHWRRPWCSPRVGLWGEYWGPTVIVETPIIVETPRVITKKKVIVKTREYNYETQFDEKTLKLYKRLRAKKDELLKCLRLGDKEERKKAISELAGFSFDAKVRKALEKILLSDPDPELRKEATKSFGKVKNKGALSILEKVRVEDSEKDVREEADRAIRKIKGY